MDKKLIEKAFIEDNFNLLKEKYTIEELNQIPHHLITEQLKINKPVELCNWLFNNGIDHNAKDKLGNTGLMIACFMKNKDFVELYLSLDTDTNPDEGITPLMLSLEGLVDKEIVELLLEKDPDVDIITTYNKTKISAISLAYQNATLSTFKKLINKSKNIKLHQETIKNILQKYPSTLMKQIKEKDEYINKIIEDRINNILKKDILVTLKSEIEKYDLKEIIEIIIFKTEHKNIKCLNEETNEYQYKNSKIEILYIMNENNDIDIIDILINEEIIYPEIRKERIKKQKELNDKIKEYNNSFKIDLGYERELDNKKVNELIEKTNELQKLATELDKYNKTNKKKSEAVTNKTKTIKTKQKQNNYYIEPNIPGEIHFNSIHSYEYEYLDENDFKKKERSVRKYNMLAYKKLTFTYYPELRKGTFLGEEVSRNAKDQTISYELKLPTDELFKKVHGEIILHYTVYAKKGIILLTNITPEGILDEGHKAELTTYKGVMISKTNPEKDLFKINLLSMLGK